MAGTSLTVCIFNMFEYLNMCVIIKREKFSQYVYLYLFNVIGGPFQMVKVDHFHFVK